MKSTSKLVNAVPELIAFPSSCSLLKIEYLTQTGMDWSGIMGSVVGRLVPI